MLNMGIEPFLVASSVNLIGAQRLARQICKDCREPIEVPAQVLIDLGVAPEQVEDFQVYRGKGCGTCNNTGYKGRIGLYEIMFFNDEIGEFVLNGASTLELKREAVRQGMRTLRASGIAKINEGMTSIEEVVRVTAPD
jgi:type IV pilus assembly protein PilB